MADSLEAIALGPSLVRKQWLSLDAAIQEVVAFERRFGPKHLLLALHAALPLFLTPELLNLIHLNFLDNEEIPWIAEADFLLSPLCRPIDKVVFEVEPRIREVLLAELESQFGRGHLNRLSSFLMTYLDKNPSETQDPEIAQSQRWIALSYLDPDQAVRQMREALVESNSKEKGEITRTISDHLQIATHIEMMLDPLQETSLVQEYRSLVNDSRFLTKIFYGDEEAIRDLSVREQANEKSLQKGVALISPHLLSWLGDTGISSISRTQSSHVFPRLSNMPYHRNPLFTGREATLLRLHEIFAPKSSQQPQQLVALVGLEGMGKTQIAIEYAYQYAHEYQAILWVRGDSPETFFSDWLNIAAVLNLPEKDEQDHNQIMEALKRWLGTNSGWLLIADDLVEFKLLREFFSTLPNKGHILLTTRESPLSEAMPAIVLSAMPSEEGIELLLRKSKVTNPSIGDNTGQIEASESVVSCRGIPLALSLAGAYINQTGLHLSAYPERYRGRLAKLNKSRKPASTPDRQNLLAVEITLLLLFEQVMKSNPPAAELMRFCCFLHPAEFTSEIIETGIPEQGSALSLMAADKTKIGVLLTQLVQYSLISPSSDMSSYSLHPLVREILKRNMGKRAQSFWAEQSVRTISQLFPENVESGPWQHSQRYLLHALVCSSLIAQWDIATPDALRLLNKVGRYLQIHGRATAAKQILNQAGLIQKKILDAALNDIQPEIALEEEGNKPRGIDFSKLEPEPEPEGADTRRHIVGLDVSAEGQRLDQIMDTLKARYRFYALLLPAQQDGGVNQYIQQHWQQLNAMSGETCLIITSLVPAHTDTSMEDFLAGLFGAEQANAMWANYQKPNLEQVKNDVYDLARQAQVGFDKLPCIVLMTDLNTKERQILRIPDWDENELTSFFGDLFSKMNAHMNQPDATRRYKELRSEFGLGFKIKVGPIQVLRKIEWAEVAHQSFLTNQELIAGIFKVLSTAFGESKEEMSVLQLQAALTKNDLTTLAPGTLIQNRYLVERPIGIGGRRAVYLVRDRYVNDVVMHFALKEMIIKLADNFDQEARQRNFEHEANMLATLNHPLIPKVYDSFVDNNRAYLVQEYINGRDLEEVLLEYIDKGELLDEETVGKWAIQICEVLDYLHTRQPKPIIFRDLKPSNVMLTPQNQTMLIDFSIATIFQPEQSGTPIGTEGYSPPEQYTGYVEPRSDIYALGVMLHQLLTQSDPQRVALFTFHERLPRALNPGVSEEMEAIIMKCLAYEIDQRWGSARELQMALEQTLGMMSITGTGQFRRVSNFAQQSLFQSSANTDTYHIDKTPRLVHKTIQFFRTSDEERNTLSDSQPGVTTGNSSSLTALETDSDLIGETGSSTSASRPSPDHVNPEGSRVASVPSPTILWKFETEEEVRSSPALVNNTLYIGSYDSNLYALNIQTGQMKWKFASESGICATPACADQLVIIGSEDNQIYALNGQNGRQEWTYRTWNYVRSSPRIVQDMVVVGSDDGFVHALELRRGRLLWKFKAWREVRSSAAHYLGIIYIGSDDERVYAIEAANGKQKWKFTTRGGVISSPTISEDLVYVGSMDGYLYALDVQMGWPAWKYRTNDFFLASPTVSAGRVYIGSVDHQFHCLDARRGRPLWRFQAGGQITSTAAAANGNVYFGCADGAVYCLDARSGQLRWRFQTNGPVISSPLVLDNVLYIGSNDHFVYALDCLLED